MKLQEGMRLSWRKKAKKVPNIREITWTSETGSTNDLAQENFQKRGVLWHCFVADSQTRGRGRKGRSWVSPPHTGLYFSVVVPRPGILEAWFPLTCAVASLTAIQSILTKSGCVKLPSIRIKWPNDLYIGNGKIAGMLCELASRSESSAWIIGIGINISTSEDAFPEDLKEKAYSISSATGCQVSRDSLLEELLAYLSFWLDKIYEGDISALCNFLEKTEIMGIATRNQQPATSNPNHQIIKSSNPLGITMGCPAGIGPEIIIKAFAANPEWLLSPPAVVIGDMNILKRASKALDINIPIKSWMPGDPLSGNAIYVITRTDLNIEDIPWGKPNSITGKASFKYVTEGIRLCQEERLSGLVTAPINKLGLKLAGIDYPGHTEILANRTNTKRYAMMLAGDKLRVTLVTIHCPLSDVANSISTEKIFQVISLTDFSLKNEFGLKEPEIAVAGLNPHGGESGMFGHEEEQVITPAIEMARGKGVMASGPYPPDTVFYQAINGKFDAVVCQYHDQGLIPFKLIHFRDGVNLTLGLPIIRTSVDHGTAYDIAGTGKADCASLEAAIRLASKILVNRLRRLAEAGR
jgi:4-hydroxythreonine-4-phosphate dehydrogenase